MTRTLSSFDYATHFGGYRAQSRRPVATTARATKLPQVAEAIKLISTGRAATTAEVTKKTVKSWRSQRTEPKASQLLAIAKQAASVRGWAIAEMADEQLLLFLATYPGPEGEWARAALTKTASLGTTPTTTEGK